MHPVIVEQTDPYLEMLAEMRKVHEQEPELELQNVLEASQNFV